MTLAQSARTHARHIHKHTQRRTQTQKRTKTYAPLIPFDTSTKCTVTRARTHMHGKAVCPGTFALYSCPNATLSEICSLRQAS